MLERCWFERSALDKLYAEADRRFFVETGGALLGWRNERDAVVARVLGPGPRAKHGLSHFEPDGKWQVAKGRAIYAASGRTIAYLGDWHTHPRGHPHPSRQDCKTACEIASDQDFRAPEPLYAIAGRPLRAFFRRSGWRLIVYVFQAGALRPVEIVTLQAR
jgi:integrative and conjugative element protein (TIGR02256 family)